MKKPDRAYHVVIFVDGQPSEVCAIYGETFFAARAALCVFDPRLEPGDIRRDPRASLS